MVEIRYYGHAMFGLSSGGTTVVIDPFNEDIGYPLPSVSPDAVVLTHEHSDHSNVALCGGSPLVIRGLAQEGKEWAKVDERVGPFHLRGVPTYHDGNEGATRGKNTVVVVEAEGVRVVHLGDLGHVLTTEQAEAVRPVAVLLVPVGGHFTIGPDEADTVVEQVQPRVVVPMHFKTKATASWPIGSIEAFMRGKAAAREVGHSFTVEAATLPAAREIWTVS